MQMQALRYFKNGIFFVPDMQPTNASKEILFFLAPFFYFFSFFLPFFRKEVPSFFSALHLQEGVGG